MQDSPHPRRRGKRVDTYGFYPLNSRFPLFRSLAQTRERRPLRKRGTAEDLFYCRGAQCAPISLPLRSAGFLAATQVVQSTQECCATFSHVVTHGTYEDKWY